ncbi:Mov34/MPN/PAD-1 family protein [Pyxidicoccus sp. MSG2]|uniref:Mov34/MPN/PAD-1 family protein n=1 Tax=Pyxidicoccus sp. MSG2 TaxID=2996790 RepID=UPI00226F2764|nr:Mov34/MPN/PAD-1 family protein [Pyxidicoccus sp. MSG2]MCY1018629.1 Mov34/MPN/PAD-1 family protein [Pyxidicoccus sp. MSG2]
MKIDSPALTMMLRFQQVEAGQPEAGGVLLGRHIVRCLDVVIDEATCPMPGDLRGPVTFHRSREHHQRVIDERWHSSEGTCLYLGEWHTHPEPHPMPSHVDVRDWRRRLREDRFEGASLFFIIVGTREVRVWEGDRDSGTLVPLLPRDS